MPTITAVQHTVEDRGNDEPAVHRFEFLGPCDVEPLVIHGPLRTADLVFVAWHLMDAMGFGRERETHEGHKR
ncbi:hypothetical protein QWY84_19425 [Aquisalimonas lutea]|uniref:hypothetical protein n=1 Tax=Aquisalimonas lutea TaxID=1327750 RepID=UPI0025B3F67F|nr:hypothetical protein [Aquisalimonas lutea]MDN3519782.1 hypothetical protein [Aquisalimonas lutea]